MLENISLDVILLGVDALDVSEGAAAHNEGEASINRLMASRARTVVAIADSSKLARHAFAKICGIDEIDMLITDTDAEKRDTDALSEAGVQVTAV